MMSQNRQQMFTRHVLLNVSRGKGNQTMKFGELIEYNMRNIFIEKSYTKYGGEASPRPFYKKSKSLSRSTVWNVIKFVFILCPSQGLPMYIKTKVLITCFYLIKSLFKKFSA